MTHGLQTASLVTEIGGQLGWLATGINFELKRSVYPGEPINCHWLIVDNDECGYAKAEARILDAQGITILEATNTGVQPGTKERERLK